METRAHILHVKKWALVISILTFSFFVTGIFNLFGVRSGFDEMGIRSLFVVLMLILLIDTIFFFSLWWACCQKIRNLDRLQSP